MRLSDLPTRGVTRLRGTSATALSAAADRRRPEDPIVVLPGLSTPIPSSPAAIIEDVLARAVVIAFELFPAWLPDRRCTPASAGVLDVTAARALSHRHDGDPGAGVALGALATAALRPQSLGAFRELPTADRRNALEYALTRSYGATRLAVALVLDEPVSPHLTDALAVAAQWLARGGSAVWLLGPGTAPIDRFPVFDGPPRTVELPEPPSMDLARLIPAPSFPPISGRPHPASGAEAALERGLAATAWAAQRQWNHTVDLGASHPPVRVDLLFQEPQLVVEVDGADHRTPDKYEADRRRDADLMVAGYRVLRLTNTRILTDLSDALAVIRTLVVPETRGGAW